VLINIVRRCWCPDDALPLSDRAIRSGCCTVLAVLKVYGPTLRQRIRWTMRAVHHAINVFAGQAASSALRRAEACCRSSSTPTRRGSGARSPVIGVVLGGRLRCACSASSAGSEPVGRSASTVFAPSDAPVEGRIATGVAERIEDADCEVEWLLGRNTRKDLAACLSLATNHDTSLVQQRGHMRQRKIPSPLGPA
jgi:hypothetical protein